MPLVIFPKGICFQSLVYNRLCHQTAIPVSAPLLSLIPTAEQELSLLLLHLTSANLLFLISISTG